MIPNITHTLYGYQMFMTTVCFRPAQISVHQNYHISLRLTIIIFSKHALCTQICKIYQYQHIKYAK